MRTAIEDRELNTELQELYAKIKEWGTNLDFLEQELAFLKAFSKKRLASHASFDQPGVDVRISQVHVHNMSIKRDLFAYLQELEDLIIQPKQTFHLELIETYHRLDSQVNDMAKELKSIKKLCLNKSSVC